MKNSGKKEAEMWGYSTGRDIKMLVTYPYVSILGYSMHAWIVYCLIFGVMFVWISYYTYYFEDDVTVKDGLYLIITFVGFLSTFGVVINGRVWCCWKQIDVLKDENVSFAICYGEWDAYTAKATKIDDAVDRFCQTDFAGTSYAYLWYAVLIRLSILKIDVEWTWDEIVLFVLAYIGTYLSHGAIFSIKKLFYCWKRKKAIATTDNSITRVLFAHIVWLVILLNAMAGFMANEYKYASINTWVVQISSSLLIVGLLYFFCLG